MGLRSFVAVTTIRFRAFPHLSATQRGLVERKQFKDCMTNRVPWITDGDDHGLPRWESVYFRDALRGVWERGGLGNPSADRLRATTRM
ncbi:hypothetical protein RRG08_045430 [Elysia crispata]|uniref:Uncharacterized protein n=1 Tax=Elysia crispata TaxID=231223 RepID=A0AAE1AWR4_9GAST|nr:hypothetical protein RRG08_045430 [Elysia crispata]